MMFSSPHKHPGSPAARQRSRGVVLGLILLSAGFAIWAPAALAQDQAVIEKLVQLNKKAMDDYDTADFDTAKKALLDAEKTGKRGGLEGHPVMARTYIHLGALYLVGFKDKQKAQHYFSKALDIQPDIKLDKTLTSASVRDAFAAAKSQKGQGDGAAGAGSPEDLFPPSAGKGGGKAGAGSKAGGAKGARAAAEETAANTAGEPAAPAAETAVRKRRSGRGDSDVEPELPATIGALDCPYPDDTPPGKKVVLRCVAAANLGVAGVALHYKGHEMTDYEKVDMSKSAKGWWQATVPKKRVDGTSLQFYFEGLDASDKPVVSNGRAESPNVMLIVENGAQAGGVPAAEEDENPLEERNRGPRFKLGKYDDSRVGLDTHYFNRRFWIGLGAGTGFVYAINGVPESRVCGIGNMPTTSPTPGTCDMGTPALARDVQVSGFGWARLGHLIPEIGFQITPDWSISIEGRNQWIPQSKKVAGYTASGAHAVLLKILRYTKQRRFRGQFGLVGGGGEGVRMNIQTDDQNLALWDTIRVGGVLLGATGGISYEISHNFTWTVGANAMYGFPLKGLVIDVNTGLQFNMGDTSGAAEAAAAKKASSVSTSIDDEEPK